MTSALGNFIYVRNSAAKYPEEEDGCSKFERAKLGLLAEKKKNRAIELEGLDHSGLCGHVHYIGRDGILYQAVRKHTYSNLRPKCPYYMLCKQALLQGQIHSSYGIVIRSAA